jgi:hypothetical protein
MTDDANGLTKRCRQCGEDIRPAAVVCPHCQASQNWWGYLHVSNTVLALLVALISVAGYAVPLVVESLKPKTAELTLSMPFVRGSKAKIVRIDRGKLLEGTTDVVIQIPWQVSNTGRRPGYVLSVGMEKGAANHFGDKEVSYWIYPAELESPVTVPPESTTIFNVLVFGNIGYEIGGTTFSMHTFDKAVPLTLTFETTDVDGTIKTSTKPFNLPLGDIMRRLQNQHLAGKLRDPRTASEGQAPPPAD